MTAEALFWTAIALMAALSAFFTSRIKTSRIPMQWGFDAKPTWFAPKLIGIWGPIAFILLVRAVIFAAVTYFPDRVNNAELGLVLLSIIAVVVHAIHLVAAQRWASKQ